LQYNQYQNGNSSLINNKQQVNSSTTSQQNYEEPRGDSVASLRNKAREYVDDIIGNNKWHT
jgi:hypothetical protein